MFILFPLYIMLCVIFDKNRDHTYFKRVIMSFLLVLKHSSGPNSIYYMILFTLNLKVLVKLKYILFFKFT